MPAAPGPIIFFDGVCNLCTRSVQFLIRHDPGRYFRYASLQSEAAEELLKDHDITVSQTQSFILLENGKIYTRSSAALRVAKKLNGLWPLLYALVIIPRFIRNALYNWIAKNRYKWFGKKEACWLPSKELNDLFLK